MAQNITKKNSVITQDSGNQTVNPKIVGVKEADEYYFHEGCYILEMHNDPDDPALSIARARVEPGRVTRWHALEAVTERYVIQQGSGYVYVGELEQRVNAGDIVVIPPGMKQRIRNEGQDDLVFLAACTPRFEPECYRDLEELDD